MSADTEEYHPGSAGPFAIRIPGIDQIIHVPGRENAEEKARLIQRAQEGESPVPEALRWIPRLINYLDSAQDLLYTAMVVGKYAFPAVFKRFLGVVGWALTLNDILDLMTNGLGLFMGGRIDKLDYVKLCREWKAGRPARINKAASFINHTNWFGFTLQAGQVLYDWTGYGISLGGIMGMASDAIYGAMAYGLGHQVLVHPPPELTQQWHAGKVAAQTPEMIAHVGILSDAQKAILFGAQYTAMTILQDAYVRGSWDDHTYEVAGFKYPTFQITDPTTRRVLERGGLDPDAPTPPAFPTYNPDLTVLQAIQIASGRVAPLYLDLNGVLGDTPLNAFAQEMIWQSALKAWSMSKDPVDIEHSMISTIERARAAAIESGVYPPFDNPDWSRPLYSGQANPDNTLGPDLIFPSQKEYESAVGRPPLARYGDPKSQQIFRWLKRAAVLHTQPYVPFKWWGFGPQAWAEPITLYSHPTGGYPLFSSLPRPPEKTVCWLGPGNHVWAAVEMWGNVAFRRDRESGEYLY